MKRILPLIFAAGLMSLIGCASSSPPNLLLRSQMDSSFTVNRETDRVIISLKDRPTTAEKTAIGQVRDVFLEAGFNVVDDVAEADRIILFSFADEALIEKGLSGFNRVDTVGGKPSIGDFRGLELYLLDTESIRKNETPIVWRALVLTSEENFRQHANDVIRYAAELYGLDVRRAERFEVSE